jgi:hypothetical protein
MRSFRMIIGLVVAVCALGALTAPAFAKTKEPKVFGKFVATNTGGTKGHGEAGEMKLGPYIFPNGCTKELKSNGSVVAGESETIAQQIKFRGCIAKRKLGKGGIEESFPVKFTLSMEFHSNGFIETGDGAEVHINAATVNLKAAKSYCTANIPAQTIPGKAVKKPEGEFEAASYETEEEVLEKKGQIKKFGPIRDRLDIEWELKKIHVNVPITPRCEFKNSEGEEPESEKYNEVTKEFEFTNGKMEGELEEITLGDGNLSFVPAI